MKKFRNLKPDEIDVRINQIASNYSTMLLYKDARCDMNILDETVGATNWKREHTREKYNSGEMEEKSLLIGSNLLVF